ncbi:MAG: hypothetical protein ACRC1R_07990 [Cetobacterium sp.]|uniref:hypothetical protein n=1 Tax=Cetobacterium sp. TaxID=2071632 RepID=UPI003F2BCBFC
MNNNLYCNFPNMKLNIAGLFTNSDLIIALKEILQNKYGIQNIIQEIYGSPNISWNGGRVLHSIKEIDYDLELRKVAEAGLRPVIIFSNPIITEEMLNDLQSNKLLEIGFKYNAKFIVSNEDLINHIKKNFPKSDIKISLIKVTIDNGRNNLEYYKFLEKNYDNYVIHPDDNLNFPLLNELNKEKVEILLNERCGANCPNRTNHYIQMSKEQSSLISNTPRKNNFLDCCKFIPEVKQLSHGEKNISLSLEEVKSLYNLGFHNFKIQGRTDNLYAFSFDILKYILKDKELYNFYPIFCFYIEKYLK